MFLSPHGLNVQSPLLWLFLGDDFRTALAWEKGLGEGFERLDISLLLSKVADDFRNPFVAWIDELSTRYGADPHWWFTEISARDTQNSSLFLSICYLEVARRCLATASHPYLIVTQSWGLIGALRLLVRSSGLKANVMSPWRCISHGAKQFARMIAFWGYFLLAATRNQTAAWVTRRGHASFSFADNPKARRVLLDTFFLDTNLSPDGIFRDRYFPVLHEWLATQGMEVWILPTVLKGKNSIANTYRWMRVSSSKFLIPEDWLRFSDYLSALVCSLKAWCWPRGNWHVQGLDIRCLVYEARWRQGVNIGPRLACLASRIPSRLKAGGFIPDQIIIWSENQIRDKALVIGCKNAFPNVAHTAVQNTPLFPNLLNLFPTAVECELGVTADRVVCSGPITNRILTEQSKGKLNTVTGCGLRYDYLWKTVSQRRRMATAGESQIALVCLPISLSLAVDVIDLMTPLFLQRDSIIWYVKPHPVNATEDLKQLVQCDILAHVVFVEGPLSDWIDKVDVVITANSGVALEAVAFGLPIIQVGSRTELNLDPLVWSNGLGNVMCYSHEEIERELDRVAKFTAVDYSTLRERGRRVRGDWFAPVTEDALHKFLGE